MKYTGWCHNDANVQWAGHAGLARDEDVRPRDPALGDTDADLRATAPLRAQPQALP